MRVTYKSKLYTVECSKLRNDEVFYKLCGGEVVAKKDTTHWMAYYFCKFFSYFDK